MRDLATIQGESRQNLINQNIDAVVEAVIDITGKGLWSLDDLREADKAILRDADDTLDNSQRQASNRELYRCLVNLIGKAKANGWPREQLLKADQIVSNIEFGATGRKLEDGVPAGYQIAA